MTTTRFVLDFSRPPSMGRMMLGALVLILAALVLATPVFATLTGGMITGVTISGTPTVPNLLTSSVSGTASSVNIHYQWKQASSSGGSYSNIGGATSSSYTLVSGNGGKYIELYVSATSPDSGTATSNVLGPVLPIPVTHINDITGTPQPGNSLTAGVLTPSAATVNYQWQESSSSSGSYSPIGTNLNTYLLTSSDEGKYIEVVANGYGSYTGSATSDPFGRIRISVTAIGAPTGTTQYNSWLTAGALTPSGANGHVDYQWLSNDTPDPSGSYSPISGATSSIYHLHVSDVGKYIEVRATGNDGYYGTVTSTYVGPITAIPVTAIGSTIGTVQVTHTLTAGLLTPIEATGHVLYQWQNSSVLGGTYSDISGATSNTYDLGPGDVAKYYQVVVTGDVTEGYSGTVTSIPVGPVAPAPITAIGSTTGTAQVDHTLTAGGLTPSEATVTYQWQNATSAVGPYAPISGATSDTYALGASDLGLYYQVVATGTGAYYGIVTSTAKGPVAPEPFTAFGPITGTAWTGNTLTAGTLTPSDATVTYQWQNASAENGPYTPISGATSSTYALSKDDLGLYYEVVATAHGAYFGAINSTADFVTMPPPTVTGISPTNGALAGGNTVTIVGTNFYGTPTVNFDSTPATGVAVVSETLITATIPAGSAGTVDVTVTTPCTTSATSTADQFTYYAIPPSDIGVYRPSTHTFYLDANTNGVWDAQPLDKLNTFGISGDLPIAGDWNHDGKTEIGVFRPSTHTFYLDLNGNGVWDGSPTDASFNTFGISGDLPIAGDWNHDGTTEIGVYRPSTHMFYLDYNGNGVWEGPSTDRSFNTFGISGDLPITGDWNFDGTTEIGVYRSSTHMFYEDLNGNGVWEGPVTDRSFNTFGISGDLPVTGDWNFDGTTEVGVFRPSTHTFYLDFNANGVWDGPSSDRSYVFGLSGDTPVSGKWA